MTVRQVFYQATVHGLVPKEETGYDTVQRILAKMRRDGKLPWNWIVDNTRGRNHPLTFKNVADSIGLHAPPLPQRTLERNQRLR